MATVASLADNNRSPRAVFRVDLSSIKVAGKTQPQFALSLDAKEYPSATIVLARPVTLRPALASGATITVTATGRLTLRGITRLVTVTISARRDGTALRAAGSIPVAFSRWASPSPRVTASSAHWPATGPPSSSSSCTEMPVPEMAREAEVSNDAPARPGRFAGQLERPAPG